jgi:hypothetical protein
MVKIICRNCGAVNIVNTDLLDDGWQQRDWLDCFEPKGFEWKLPAGKITPVVGPAIYISATGEQLSRDMYIKKYNIDPERAYKFMRTRASKYVPDNSDSNNQEQEENGSPARIGNPKSSGNTPKKQDLAWSSPPMHTPAWADEEDWV